MNSTEIALEDCRGTIGTAPVSLLNSDWTSAEINYEDRKYLLSLVSRSSSATKINIVDGTSILIAQMSVFTPVFISIPIEVEFNFSEGSRLILTISTLLWFMYWKEGFS
ncbi:MAG: hypothetical protein AAF065_10380 [Verrucomicrobiota bacterium]